MKTYWKWILGILIALAVIVAIPLGMHLLMNNRYIAAPAMYAWQHAPTGPAFDMPYGFDGRDGPRHVWAGGLLPDADHQPRQL